MVSEHAALSTPSHMCEAAAKRVMSYAESAKWVARLRASKTDFHDLILRTDMESGHQGRSGRGGTASQNAEIIGWLIAHVREGILQ